MVRAWWFTPVIQGPSKPKVLSSNPSVCAHTHARLQNALSFMWQEQYVTSPLPLLVSNFQNVDYISI
jgi:hypothetical protein